MVRELIDPKHVFLKCGTDRGNVQADQVLGFGNHVETELEEDKSLAIKSIAPDNTGWASELYTEEIQTHGAVNILLRQ